MSRPLSDTAKKIYQFIVCYKLDHDGVPPTHRDIMEAAELKSVSTVAHHLTRLEDAGMIKRMYNRDRSIMVTGGQWSVPV